jgi:hypothetical protein
LLSCLVKRLESVARRREIMSRSPITPLHVAEHSLAPLLSTTKIHACESKECSSDPESFTTNLNSHIIVWAVGSPNRAAVSQKCEQSCRVGLLVREIFLIYQIDLHTNALKLSCAREANLSFKLSSNLRAGARIHMIQWPLLRKCDSDFLITLNYSQ